MLVAKTEACFQVTQPGDIDGKPELAQACHPGYSIQ